MSDKYYNEDGSIYSFRDKNRYKKNRNISNFKPSAKHSGRYYSDKVSFIATFLRYLLTYIRLFIVWLILCFIFMKTNITVFTILSYIFLLGTIVYVVHFIYFIVRCAIEGNLRL